MPNAQSPMQPTIPIPAKINNPHVAYYLNNWGRFCTEIANSNSSDVPVATAADIARWKSYLDASSSFLDYAAGAAIPPGTTPSASPALVSLDMPHIKDQMPFSVEPLDPFPSLQNEEAELILRLFIAGHAEMARSSSANMTSGFDPFDVSRARALIASIRDFIVTYIPKATPIDMVASNLDVSLANPKVQPIAGP